MQTFQIKTHKHEQTYSKPHFYILNKGLNSGKPCRTPVRNSFVVSTETIEQKEALFQLSLMLLESKCYNYYLKGSVIPFIGIHDVKNLLIKNQIHLLQKEVQTKIEAIKKIEVLEKGFQNKLKTIQELKISLLRSCKLER